MILSDVIATLMKYEKDGHGDKEVVLYDNYNDEFYDIKAIKLELDTLINSPGYVELGREKTIKQFISIEVDS